MLKDKLQINNKVCPKTIRSGKEIDLSGKQVESMNFGEWKNKKELQDLLDSANIFISNNCDSECFEVHDNGEECRHDEWITKYNKYKNNT